MAIKTMMVVQRASGRKVTINATDFDASVYMTEAELAAPAMKPKAKPEPEPEPKPKAKPAPDPEPEARSRRRR